MKESFASLIQILILAFVCQAAFAQSADGLESTAGLMKEVDTQTPYISLNVGVEMTGLATAVEAAAEGLNLIGESLQNLLDNPELTPEHHQKIDQALTRVDELGKTLTQAIDQLPETVDRGMAPVVKAGNDLSNQVKKIVLITSVALIMIILAALWAVYYFVLAPGTQSIIKTATMLDELAKTLKTTAEIVEVSSERNLKVMEEVRKTQKHSVD
jgi:hypothetical protein